MKMEEAIRILKNNGHKYTDKRRDMIEMFIKEDKYINAKTVQQQMNNHYPGISFDTIHRNLHLFKILGIVGELSWMEK